MHYGDKSQEKSEHDGDMNERITPLWNFTGATESLRMS